MRRARKRAPRRTSANGRGWVRRPSRAAPGAGSAYARGRFEILADTVRTGGRPRHVWLVWEHTEAGWRLAAEHTLLKSAKAAATSTARQNRGLSLAPAGSDWVRTRPNLIGVGARPPLPPRTTAAGHVPDGFAWRMNGSRGHKRTVRQRRASLKRDPRFRAHQALERALRREWGTEARWQITSDAPAGNGWRFHVLLWSPTEVTLTYDVDAAGHVGQAGGARDNGARRRRR